MPAVSSPPKRTSSPPHAAADARGALERKSAPRASRERERAAGTRVAGTCAASAASKGEGRKKEGEGISYAAARAGLHMTPSRTMCHSSPTVRRKEMIDEASREMIDEGLYFAGLVAHAAPETPSGEVRSGLVVPAVQKAEEAKQAAAVVMSEDDRKRGDPLRPEDLARTAPDNHKGAEGHCILPSHDTTDSDVHLARDRRGHASLRADGRALDARQPVRLIPDSSEQLTNADKILYSAQRCTDSGAATPKTLKERPPEAAGRSSPSHQSKSSSRLQFKHLQKRWDDDLERDKLAKSRSESTDAATADSVPSDECLQARLQQVDGILETLSFSSPFLPSPIPLRSSEAGAIGGKQKKLRREKEVERASWHIANRLASAFDDADARNNLLGRGELGIISERARSRSAGPAERQQSKSAQQDTDWIARHTYVSMIKARPPPPPPPPTPHLDEMSRKCEMLDTLLLQRDEKIRALKSDLAIADTAREKLSTTVNILEGTVETLRQQNVHCEGQLARCVDVCHFLREQLTTFSNKLKESDRAIEKQRELLLNVEADSESKMKDWQFHEESMRSQIEALKAQLDIAERSCESQRFLMSKLENQMATLQKEQKEDGDKFAHELGRAVAREAELAETNRQLTRKCEILDTLLQQRDDNQKSILQEKKKDGEKFQSIMRVSASREAGVAETNRQLRRDIVVLREQVARLSSSVRKPRTVFGS